MCLARSWNYYCATHSPTSVIADSAHFAANEAECRIRYTEIHTEQPRVLMEVGHPAQNPAIGSACRAFAAVATPRESPSYNSQSVFFGAVARIVELGYWVKTARQQQLSKHHHHHHHPWKQQQ